MQRFALAAMSFVLLTTAALNVSKADPYLNDMRGQAQAYNPTIQNSVRRTKAGRLSVPAIQTADVGSALPKRVSRPS